VKVNSPECIVVYLDILILNKQRLAAAEELEKLKNEKDELLVERINQLEAESQSIKFSFFGYSLVLMKEDSVVVSILLRIESSTPSLFFYDRIMQ